MSLAQWDRPHFKGDEPSRHERAKQKKADADAAWKAVCQAVDRRDARQCRCCDKRSDPDATGLLTRGHRHHIVYRSAGGPDESWNLVHLCAACHDDEHRGKLAIESYAPGGADGPLIFKRKDENGLLYITREEIAVRVVRKD